MGAYNSSSIRGHLLEVKYNNMDNLALRSSLGLRDHVYIPNTRSVRSGAVANYKTEVSA